MNPLNWIPRTFDDKPESAFSWQELKTKWCIISLEKRPGYCDRGRFIAKVTVFAHHALTDLYLDEADGWPRYYFNEERAKAEIADWIACRRIPVETPPTP
jgi:hypothetical protein